jgi:hypothetical protein
MWNARVRSLHPIGIDVGRWLSIADANSVREDVMAKAGKDQDFDEILSKIGPDATATFDNSPSNPTEHAGSEATNAATAVNGDDAVLEEEDDDLAALEEDDELDEEEDVEDEAGV